MVQFDEILFDMGTKIDVVGVDCYLVNPTIVWGNKKNLENLRIGQIVENGEIGKKGTPRGDLMGKGLTFFVVRDALEIEIGHMSFYLSEPTAVLCDPLKVKNIGVFCNLARSINS